MTAPGAFLAGDVLTAADLNGLPGGYIGYAQAVTNQAGITTEVDVTSLSVTFTAFADRRYKITALANVLSAGNIRALLKITDGSNVVKAGAYNQLATTTGTLTAVEVVSGLSGSITRKARLLQDSGTGGLTVVASATIPAFILVEDIGEV